MQKKSWIAFWTVIVVLCIGAPSIAAGPFVCDYDPRVQIGTIAAGQSPYLNEASGLVQSRNEPDVFWSHQDNGNDERLFAIHRDGHYLGTWDLAVSNARDPEDIAMGPGPIPGVDYVYYGDIGHNYGIWGCTTHNSSTGNCAGCPAGRDCYQRDPVVWRAVEPTVDPDQAYTHVASYPADTIRMRFPDSVMLGHQQDVETLLVDPLTRDIYIVTKRSSPNMVFRAPYPQSTTETITLEWVADLPFGGGSSSTGGDISSDGRMIIIRRYGDGWIWQRPPGTTVAQALNGSYCYRSGLGETQGEAVAFDISNSGTFYTTSEGGGSVPIYLYHMVNDGCVDDADCADGDYCNGSETCGAGGDCETGIPPTCPGQLCSEPLDQCVDCLINADCAADETCDVASGQCEPTLVAGPLPIDNGDIWRHFSGVIEPPANWTAIGFDDTLWNQSPGGFGYGADCVSGRGTTIADMQNNYPTLYLRIPFTVENAASVSSLTLNVDYDDAFVAYLNGQEVARSNVIGNPPISTQLATANHECSGGSPDPNPAEDFTVSTTHLVSGLNVLAVQGHNLTLGSSDFTLNPALSATTFGSCVVDADCDDGVYCNGAETCSASFCQTASPVVCDDGLACTTDSCNESTDSCDFATDDTVCDDGLFCNGAESCNPSLGCQDAPTEPCAGSFCDETADQCAECQVNGDCDDGLYCNGAETCSAGSCQTGSAVVCDDGIACTADSCNESTDSCNFTGNDSVCNDGLYCNGSETCNASVGCQAGSSVVCNDGVACTTDSCNESTDSCNFVTDDTVCDDGLFCNGAETCNASLGCRNAQNEPCVGSFCDETADQCAECLSDDDCDDGIYCNGAETCSAGSCESGSAVVCDDGVACTADSCNESTDSCDFTTNDSVCNDGLFCNGAESCNASLGCQSSSTAACVGSMCDEAADQCVECLGDGDCDDGLFCNGAETCSAGSCQAASPVVCDDGIACTADSCNESTDSCDFTTNDNVCDDGLFCNGAESCNASLGCQSAPTAACVGSMCDETADQCVECLGHGDCDDGLYCNGAETCSAGSCQAGSAVACDDGVACTTDSCNESTDSCDFTANDTVCDDGQFCNGAETCNPASGCQVGAAQCQGLQCDEAADICFGCGVDAECDDGLFCNGVETCSAGVCQSGTAVVCDDGIACTTDSCNESTDRCDNTTDDSVCDDGLFCNGAETCNASLGCQAAPTEACVGSLCDEAADQCVECLGDGDCDDGLYCNGAETCSAGSCQTGSVVVCDDGVACTTDSCNESTDRCDNTTDDSVCDDGLYCNGVETCNASLGCQSSPTQPCVGSLCDEATDQCVACLGDGDCDDGLFCNGAETCSAGSCQTGSAVVCDDGVACTTDSCNESTDSCAFTTVDSVCDDGVFCNGTETCNATSGCQAAAAPQCPDLQCDEVADVCFGCTSNAECDDGDSCTTDSCQSGSCVSAPVDTDGDQVPDCTDNCPGVYNPGQEDFDEDGLADACENGARLADMNRSGRVDGFDLAWLARAFSFSCGDPMYDPNTDVDRNCLIDGEDLAILATYFGASVL